MYILQNYVAQKIAYELGNEFWWINFDPKLPHPYAVTLKIKGEKTHRSGQGTDWLLAFANAGVKVCDSCAGTGEIVDEWFAGGEYYQCPPEKCKPCKGLGYFLLDGPKKFKNMRKCVSTVHKYGKK